MTNIELLEKKAAELGCKVFPKAEMKKYTTFKIGGNALCLIEIEDVSMCGDLIKICVENNIEYHILGKGSNLIIDDHGVNAVFFKLTDNSITLKEDNTIICSAGVSLSRLCSFALENNLTGLEFAYGIPGSVGGAVYMNAGAYGGEIKDVIVSATAMSDDVVIREMDNISMGLAYRKSAFMNSNDIILSAEFKLEKGDPSEIKAKMDELMEKRRSKQPLEYPSAGSTFKRPEGSFASLLIDQCGLKGLSVGDAEVSTKHSGFIINKGNATFDDLMKLIAEVRDIVEEKTGYILECEPEIISDREEYRK